MQHSWRPTASWEVLGLRAEMLRSLRTFFHARGMLEVETPLVSADVVVDRHLDPFSTQLAEGRDSRALYLQTSPEFGMKRLLAAGGPAMYQITRAFRQEESGPRHNPEFTIVEWYRPGDDLARGMELLSDVSEVLFELGPAMRLSYADAFRRYAAVDPHRASIAELAAVAERKQIDVPQSLAGGDRDGYLDLLLVELVEPKLGWVDGPQGRRPAPTILFDYPASQAALAHMRREGDVQVAERFELYVESMELANGYHELLDAEVLLARNRAANRARSAAGKSPLPEDSRLIAAMRAGLPPSSGCALGFDRAVMLRAGAASIRDVLCFPIDRA